MTDQIGRTAAGPEPIDRRSFLNRVWLAALSVFGIAFGGASIAFLWPERRTRFVLGKLSEIRAEIERTGRPMYFSDTKLYVVPYDTSDPTNRYVEAGAATHGIIHGDLFRDNVLWQDGRLVAILDFEQASGGSLAYDLAVCINDWCWDGAPRLDLVRALLQGYETRRALADADRVALPIEVRAAAMRFTITRITDVYLARVHNPEKDFRAFLARSEAWRGPALGQLTSLL
jgi:Ser/Thr protein kinase RdoA (MazF antagonist)